MSATELRRLATANGIANEYWDATGTHRVVPERTLRAVLDAMGAGGPAAAAPWPPVLVVTAGGPPPAWSPPAHEPVTVELDSGEQRDAPARLPGDLPTGYHRLRGATGATLLVVAPPCCHLPDRLAHGGRAWGWALQLYALRSGSSWGSGDLGDLRELAAGDAAAGAGFLLLNPLHASDPGEASPYNPSSRLFRNPVYLRPERLLEARHLTAAARSRFAELAAAGRALSGAPTIDRGTLSALKDEALRLCHGALPTLPARGAELEAHLSGVPALRDFATFCAIQREHGTAWGRWPVELRRPGPAAERYGRAHAGEVSYQAWLQVVLDEQLAAVPRSGIGLLHDLAVGVSPDGFDAWMFRDQIADGITVGAPPDALGPKGQDWGLPPFSPAALTAAGYRPFVQTIRATMAHAGGIRIDHVMGLFRLFWIPEGAPPTDGTYVRYPAEDLLGIVALESSRAQALVVGEDLGTVEPGVRERLARSRILSYRLAWFERDDVGAPRRAGAYPRLAMAAATTHDLPTTPGFFTGEDLRHQREIGTVAGEEWERVLTAHVTHRAELLGLLVGEGLLDAGEGDPGAITLALYRFLARTPSMLVTATLDDALGALMRPNVPGTTTEHPNWSLPLPVPLEQLGAHPGLGALADALRQVH